uniref:SFRICE_006447 n=1 Tax=Spodoptera frugiperda TaxID=7108 RepID=A0A2H1V2C5_SPOFR
MPLQLLTYTGRLQKFERTARRDPRATQRTIRPPQMRPSRAVAQPRAADYFRRLPGLRRADGSPDSMQSAPSKDTRNTRRISVSAAVSLYTALQRYIAECSELCAYGRDGQPLRMDQLKKRNVYCDHNNKGGPSSSWLTHATPNTYVITKLPRTYLPVFDDVPKYSVASHWFTTPGVRYCLELGNATGIQQRQTALTRNPVAVSALSLTSPILAVVIETKRDQPINELGSLRIFNSEPNAAFSNPPAN